MDHQAVSKYIPIPWLGAEESQDPWLETIGPNQISWYYLDATCCFYLDPICTAESNEKKQELHQASGVLMPFATRHSQIMATATTQWPLLKSVPEAAVQLSSVITLEPWLYAFWTFSETAWKIHMDYHGKPQLSLGRQGWRWGSKIAVVCCLS